MHAHDRTLLAKLGFADPDKNNPAHDLACQYLAQPEQAERLISMSGVEKPTDRPTIDGWYSPRGLLEVPVSKGADQYKTTIGFIDVVIEMGRRAPCAAVEVKAARAKSADIIRQINLYREYHVDWTRISELRWFVATLYDLTPLEKAALRDANITPIRVGDKFLAWAESLNASTNSEPVEEL